MLLFSLRYRGRAWCLRPIRSRDLDTLTAGVSGLLRWPGLKVAIRADTTGKKIRSRNLHMLTLCWCRRSEKLEEARARRNDNRSHPEA